MSSSTPAIPDAYGAGHLPDAVNVHEIFTYLATSTPEGMQELKTKFADAFGGAGLSGKETAVIYEQSMNSGFGQSCRGYYLLTMLGYPKIKVLHGGYDAWAAAGLPVTTDVPSPVTASFSIVPEAGDILIDAKTMLAAVGKPGDRAARRPRRRRVDRRQLVALRQGFLPAQGTDSRRGLARMVPHDEADRGGTALQVEGRNPGRMRHRRHLPEHAGLSLLLQGRAGLEHVPRAEERRA